MTSGQNTQIPFFDDYLAGVLRPKVERLLSGQAEQIEKRVFAGVVRAIAEQTGVDAERVERLLSDELGMSISVNIDAQYTTGAAAADDGVIDVDVEAKPIATKSEAKPEPKPATKPATKGKPLQVSPLAKAVASSKR